MNRYGRLWTSCSDFGDLEDSHKWSLHSVWFYKNGQFCFYAGILNLSSEDGCR